MTLIKAFDQIRVGEDPSGVLELATRQYADTKLGRPIITTVKTGNYTAVAGELVMVDATNGPITITLPAAVLGIRVTVKKLDASANVVTIAAAGSDTIGSMAAATVPVKLQDQATTLQAAGSTPANWVVPHNHVSPAALDARYDAKLTPTSVKTANYTAAVGELVLVDDSGGGITIALPACATGAQVAVKKVVASTNTVTVARAGTDTIGAAGSSTTLVLLDQQISFQGNGTSWLPIHNMLGLSSLDARYTAKSTLTTRGDTYVATGPGTVVRQAVGGSNDPWIADPAQTNGVRYDSSRGSDLSWLREAQGLLCSSAPGVGAGSGGGGSLAFSASIRTVQFLIGRLPSGTSIGTIRFWIATAMAGGAGSVAIYGATSLSATSWSRLGSAVTCTSQLQSSARQSVTYSATTSDNLWLRLLFAITTAPSTYPSVFVGMFPLVRDVASGHVLTGYSNSTAVPPSTIDPSTGWSDTLLLPAAALTA